MGFIVGIILLFIGYKIGKYGIIGLIRRTRKIINTMDEKTKPELN